MNKQQKQQKPADSMSPTVYRLVNRRAKLQRTYLGGPTVVKRKTSVGITVVDHKVAHEGIMRLLEG